MRRHKLNLCLSTLFAKPFDISAADFDAALAACEAAGVDGLSLWSLHQLLLGQSSDELAAKIRARGLDVVCIEAIYGWANAATADAAIADAAMPLQLCVDFGATSLAAVVLEPELDDIAAAAANLAAVADHAADAGVTVCVEYLPWSGVPDIGTCWELLRRTERDNVGFLFDSWHWQHQPGGPTGQNLETLASIPGEFISVFQLCDAEPDPTDDPLGQCMTNRPLPGEGVVDHAALFAVFREIGADPVIAPEVFNEQLLAGGATAMAQQVVTASRQVLAEW